MKSVGVVGCGAIGRAIIAAADRDDLPVGIAGVTTRTPETAASFLASLTTPPPLLDLDDLIGRSDIVVEAAGGHIGLHPYAGYACDPAGGDAELSQGLDEHDFQLKITLGIIVIRATELVSEDRQATFCQHPHHHRCARARES